MKKILFAAVLVIGSALRSLAAEDPGVNEKVLEAFNKTFQNVKDVSWIENESSYEVRFKQDEITSKITYDKQGNIVSTLRYYYEDKLPIMILTRVKQKYSDKKIFGVVEESSDQGTFYHITLEDEKTWVNLNADSYGNLSVEKKFRKA
jgi:hypothetical protein